MSGCECRPDAKRKRDSAHHREKGAQPSSGGNVNVMDHTCPFRCLWSPGSFDTSFSGCEGRWNSPGALQVI